MTGRRDPWLIALSLGSLFVGASAVLWLAWQFVVAAVRYAVANPG